MVNRKILLCVTVIVLLTLSAGVAWADEVTSVINYQGRLADSSGSPLSGTYTMTFRLYEAATGGTALATDIHDVVVTDGLFNTEIDFYQSYFDGRALWLGVEVGADSEMTPRQEFGPVPYALSLVPGAKIIGAAQWNLNVETTHASGRALRGQASATSGTNYGVVGASRSPDGYGGYFYNDRGGVGVYGRGSEYGGYFDGKVYVRDNVGIGTTAPGPSYKLTVDGGGSSYGIHVKNVGDIGIESEGSNYGVRASGRSRAVSATSDGGHAIHGTSTDGVAGYFEGKGYFSGNLGIGTTSPGAKLDVNGDATVTGDLIVGGDVETSRVAYSSPRTHYFVVGGEGFVPGTNLDYCNTYGMGGACIYSGSGALVAPVHLPHGAVVTEFKVFFNDGSSSDMSVRLSRLILSSGAYASMVTVSSSGISGYGSKTETTIHNAIIDNTAYGYKIDAWSSSWDRDLKIMGALVTYTISEAQ